MKPFNHIAIVSRREGNGQIAETVKQLAAYLVERGSRILLDSPASDILADTDYQVCSHDELGQTADLAIVVGGDGSMLTAARSFAKHNVPVVGINRGGLGFLTDINPDQLIEQLEKVFAGDYVTEERFLLEATITWGNKQTKSAQALNDVVLSSGLSARMMEFELYVDELLVYSQRSNGLIISTPTGSTAYALSGGGPIMHPSLDAIALVPMFPHTLTSRPLVVGGNSRIKIVSSDWHDFQPIVSCDGHVHFEVSAGDEIHISKMAETLTLIHPLPHDFYESCRSKLGWGSKLGD